jgi:[acyl-carrier-protein] S-malonyltransferase
MRTVALFAGIPPDPHAALRGAVTRDERYRATFRAGEAWWAARADEPLALGAAEGAARDVAVTLHGCAAAETLQAAGPPPDAIAEHSLGLYAALYAARAIDLEAALGLAHAAAGFIAEAARTRPGGLLAVVGFPIEALLALARDAASEAGGGAACAVATVNSAHQAVLGGDLAAIEVAARLARARGALDARRLPTRAALHTPLLEDAAARLGAFAAGLAIRAPEVPVFSHLDAEPLADAAAVRCALARQLAAPVRFALVVERLRRDGFRRYCDAGPGDVLGRLVRWIDRDAEVVFLDGRERREAAWTRR